MSVVQDPVSENLLFIGTDFGVYFSIDKGKNWQKWTNGFPSVSTRDLKIHPREGDLIIGTFGRAAWILDNLSPLRSLATQGKQILDDSLRVFSAQDAYQASYRSVDGIRFIGDGEFVGGNKSVRVARIPVWVKPKDEIGKKRKDKREKRKDKREKKKDKRQKKKDKRQKTKDKREKTKEKELKKSQLPPLKKGSEHKADLILNDGFNATRCIVIDSAGDTVRVFEPELKEGFQYVYWSLNRDGVRYPSRRKAKKDALLPGGRQVLPGTYKIVLVHKGHKDSTAVVVKADPRIDISLQQMEAKDKARADFERQVEKVSNSFSQLMECSGNIERTNNWAKDILPDSTQKKLKEMANPLKKKIDSLERIMMLPEDLKGIHGASDYLLRDMRRASGYLNAADGAPGENATNKLNLVTKEMDAFQESVQKFLESEGWSDYKLFIQSLEFSPLKE